MNRFENVDVLAALEQLMRQNTAFYRNDFEIDKEIIRQSAASDRAGDKTLLWMSRPSGTYCFRERDVFLQGARRFPARYPAAQHMAFLWGADPRPYSGLRRGADRQGGRKDTGQSL